MTIEEKAKKEYPSVNPYDYPETCSYNKTSRNSFIRGARWMTENAIKWVEDNIRNYYHNASQTDNCQFDDTKVLEDFKKALEE